METFSVLLAICADADRMFSFIYASINGWVNNGEVSDLRRNRVHCVVIVMACQFYGNSNNEY